MLESRSTAMDFGAVIALVHACSMQPPRVAVRPVGSSLHVLLLQLLSAALWSCLEYQQCPVVSPDIYSTPAHLFLNRASDDGVKNRAGCTASCRQEVFRLQGLLGHMLQGGSNDHVFIMHMQPEQMTGVHNLQGCTVQAKTLSSSCTVFTFLLRDSWDRRSFAVAKVMLHFKPAD